LPSIINRMLQEGQEGALVTGICTRRTNREMVDFNNYSWFRSRLKEAVAAEDYLFR
jgi:hypothetical protein